MKHKLHPYKQMVGLLDGNNFYVSCERVFQPQYRNKPCLVLSSNDGCVIARSDEAKILGVKMGVPEFQVKDLIKRYGIHCFSSNYELYDDMSKRMLGLAAHCVQEIELTSVDECFMNLRGYEHLGLYEYGRHIVTYTTRGCGIPVSLGIAPTKTLAKIANHFAKKYPGYKSVCVIDSEEKRIKALKLTPVGDVWGIGKKTGKKLEEIGVKTAYDFTQMNRWRVRKQLTVMGEKTWLELQGEPCFDLELAPPAKKGIQSSATFGKTTSDLKDLRQAVSRHVTRVATKLRQQGSVCRSVMVYIHTNLFNKKQKQYKQSYILELPVASNSTTLILKHAFTILDLIFKEEYEYKKAGVILQDITPAGVIQQDMLYTYDWKRQFTMDSLSDHINRNSHEKLLFHAVEGNKDLKTEYQMNQRSNRYTTRPTEFLRIC